MASSPFQLFDALPGHIEDALRASIQRFGILVPVVRDQHDRIIDGHHRVRLAEELGVEYPVTVVTVANAREATEVARTLNADRRHLTPEQRREVVGHLRANGHSTRAIGAALGIDAKTVRNDLARGDQSPRDDTQAFNVENLTESDRVLGLDGKSYPAQRPGLSTDVDRSELSPTGATPRLSNDELSDLLQNVVDKSVREDPRRARRIHVRADMAKLLAAMAAVRLYDADDLALVDEWSDWTTSIEGFNRWWDQTSAPHPLRLVKGQQ